MPIQTLDLHRVIILQVNLCQKLLFLHQLSHNMMSTEIVSDIQNNFVHNMFSPYSAKRRASDKDLPVSNVPRKLLRFWSPTQSNVVALWLDDPQSNSYFDAQPEKRGFFYDCPPKLYTFRRPCNSIWILEFWRRNRRKRQSHKIPYQYHM